jgi:hypothetical protein
VLVSGNAGEPDLPPLSPEAPDEGYSVLYACTDDASACTTPESEGELANPYKALYGKPLNRTAEEFKAREGSNRVFVANNVAASGAVFAGGSRDFGTLLFEANDALPGIEGPVGSQLQNKVTQEIVDEENNDQLYDLSGNKLYVVDLLPSEDGGGIADNATFGAPPFPETPALNQPDFSRVISADGRRVFWTDLTTGVVYVRLDNTTTLRVSEGAARYWTSAANGRYAFYTEGEALYRFDLEAKSPSEERIALSSASAGVQGLVGASEDGEDVYFVAKGVLGSGVSSEGSTAVPGQPNLYLSQAGREPQFIATLSNNDGHAIAPFIEAIFTGKNEYGDWLPGSGQRTAEVAADGSSLVFMSDQKLASAGYPEGYPNDGLEEVYLYQAPINQLTCVSCSNSGEPPPTSEAGAAAFLPISWSETYLPHWVSDDGSRVFFDSVVPLVAQDTNGAQDVYEWERENAGSCTPAAAVNGGCVYLLSGGMNPHASWLLDASATGNDAFVITRAQLTPRDQNGAFDVFDARVGGIEPPAPTACTDAGCQGVPASAPVFQTPPSGTFDGVGNFLPSSNNPRGKTLTRAQKLKRALKACQRRHNKRRREVCKASARRRYGRAGAVKGAKHGLPRGGE